jgi:hypothetical protein
MTMALIYLDPFIAALVLLTADAIFTRSAWSLGHCDANGYKVSV